MSQPFFPLEVKTWLQDLAPTHPELNQDVLRAAFALACDLNERNIPINFIQSCEIANLLIELPCDSETVASAILYPFFNSSEKTQHAICKQLDPLIYKLLLGISRRETIDSLPISHGRIVFDDKQLDQLRRMLLAIVGDVRIVLVKLAERIFTLKHLKTATPEKQRHIAQQTFSLYAPLANRLGIGQFKWKLEDLAFRALHPQIYSNTSKALKERRKDREKYIETLKQEITHLIQTAHISHYEISGRAKHIYSIYSKRERKQVPPEQIYDTNAFRILVPSIQDCYTLLSVIHAEYNYVPEEFDDYIVKPKPNGYRSIHTVIIDTLERNVEIQLRTFDMHIEAELGVCAHWRYKENKFQANSYEDKIRLLRDMMSWQQELKHPSGDHASLYRQLFEDRVHVFTPKNDILDLNTGATPLDAAYAIHTEIGHRCKGAKLNGKIVPLTEKLKTGDVVEIPTGKTVSPSRDWINPERGYLATASAIQKVKSWFRHQYREEKIARGLEIWEKAAKREGINKNDLTDLVQFSNVNTVDDLLIAFSLGVEPVAAIIRKLKPTEKTNAQLHDLSIKPEAHAQAHVANTNNLLTQLARCCSPIPGDPIVGYITKGRGITIHRQDCPNFLSTNQIFPERMLSMNWDNTLSQKYPITLMIVAVERPGLVRDVSSVIANEHLRLLAIQAHIKKEENQCVIQLTLEIEGLESLQRVLTQLAQLPDVIRAKRKM